MTRHLLAGALGLLLLFSAAAVAAGPAPTESVFATASGEAAGYKIGPRDVIAVDVYDEEDLSGQKTVAEDGSIFMPLVGRIEVEGLTPPEIAARVTALLKDGYLVHPQVAVRVVEHRSQKVAVVGAVKEPGEYYLSGRTTLLEMLARAGNIDHEKSAREVRVRRATGETVVVSVESLVTSGKGDFVLKADDVVSVPEGQFVYIAGEVEQPGAIVFWEGLTLTQALTKAGGPSETAKLRGAYLLRDGERLPVNLKRILDGREADMTLRPGDQLFLKQSPI